MEINGVAHVMLTVSNFEACLPFYEKLLPYFGMKPVIRNEDTFYCVGGRTAVGIMRCEEAHRGESFAQRRIGLHHVCLRARERGDVDEVYGFLKTIGRGLCIRRRLARGRRGITRSCSRIRMGSASRSIMFRERGCWRDHFAHLIFA
jgi:catechol 2,3-dioxygenase-like lactoylglutathione lyase family enzyme